jgi:putative flippase GtrA
MTSLSNTNSKRKAETAQFARFVALGGCSAAVNWISRFPLERVMGFPAAITVAYLIGMAVAFLLFRRFVFPNSPQPLDRQVKFFVLVNIAAVCQVWVVSMGLVYYFFPAVGFSGPLAEPIGHAIGIGFPIIPSYFGHRLITFRQS